MKQYRVAKINTKRQQVPFTEKSIYIYSLLTTAQWQG